MIRSEASIFASEGGRGRRKMAEDGERNLTTKNSKGTKAGGGQGMEQ